MPYKKKLYYVLFCIVLVSIVLLTRVYIQQPATRDPKCLCCYDCNTIVSSNIKPSNNTTNRNHDTSTDDFSNISPNNNNDGSK